MGNSLPVARKNETAQERQRRLESKYGVLIPPSFACPSPFQGGNNTNTNNIPLCSQSLLLKAAAASTTTPSIIDYLWMSHSGRRLLQEYMSRGIWFKAGGGGQGQAFAEPSILVSLDTATKTALLAEQTNTTNGTSATTTGSSSSFLWAGQQNIPVVGGGSASLQLLAPTQGQPSFHAAYAPIPHLFQVDTCMNASGVGWVGAKLHSNRMGSINNSNSNEEEDGMNVLVGTWFPILLSTSDDQSSSNSPLDASVKTRTSTSPKMIHAYGAAEFKQSILAMEATIPLDGTMSLSTSPLLSTASTMLSLNLNNVDTTNNDNNTNAPPPPPLWLTLLQKKTHNGSEMIMNVNQTLSFDRKVVNVLEDRAPNVRQTLGWAVQLTKRGNPSSSSSSSNTTNLSVGVAWQWNRALALKGIVHQNTGILEYGLICKRWDHPRMTLSILNQFQLFSNNHSNTTDHHQPPRHSFVGFGIELETTPFSPQQHEEDPPMVSRSSVPVTKVHLP